MLKILHVVSWLSMVFAVLTVIGLVILWQKGEKDILTYLNQPGIMDRCGVANSAAEDKQGENRLVLAAIALAQRLNPPVVQDEMDKINEPLEDIVIEEEIIAGPLEKIPISTLVTPKFELIGTVICEDAPQKSLALIRLSNGQWQWYPKGQRLGHYFLGEIRNGSALITHNGKTTEFFVPAKPQGQKLTTGNKI